jgi:hypothetical protein
MVDARLVIACGAACVAATLIARRMGPRWRVAWLMRSSHAHYASKRYDDALSAAVAARTLAAGWLGAESAEHGKAMLHLAAVHAAMRQNAAALAVLDECDALATRVHGAASLHHVPTLHARAEVLEEADDMDGAVQALSRAREIRRAVLGQRHPAYARACFNQAGLTVRYASSAPDSSDEWRAAQVGHAAALAIEASEVALAAGDAEQGLEYAEELLDLILSGGEDDSLAQLDGCFSHVESLNKAIATAKQALRATQ